jgi:hypothetical protein
LFLCLNQQPLIKYYVLRSQQIAKDDDVVAGLE